MTRQQDDARRLGDNDLEVEMLLMILLWERAGLRIRLLMKGARCDEPEGA
jgi:hypothetical protein